MRDKYEKILEEAFTAAKSETRVFNKHWIDSPWSGFFEGKDPLKVSPTGVHEDTITHICRRFSSAPPNASDFVIHRGLQRILNSNSVVFFLCVVNGHGRNVANISMIDCVGQRATPRINVKISSRDKGSGRSKFRIVKLQECMNGLLRTLETMLRRS